MPRRAEIFSERLRYRTSSCFDVIDEYDNDKHRAVRRFIDTSTHGEGEPPDNAWDFRTLEDDNVPNLNHEIFSTSFR